MGYVICAALGAIIGGALLSWPGSAFGLLLGACFAHLWKLSARLGVLERRVSELGAPPPESAPEAMPEAVATAGLPEEPELDFDLDLEPAAPPPAPATSRAPTPHAERSEKATRLTPSPDPSPGERLIAALRRFFTGGNVVVRVALIVLFFGVAFLLRYAAERHALPIELRLAGIGIGALVLFGFGWRLRRRRAGYALLLQGGAVGMSFLTVFASAKIYGLVPMELAFVMMVGLVAAAGALAVAQNSRALATMGIVGGFLAPVLLASGSGNHVVVFSYYGLLNAGILGVAWFKAWRSLNLIGFVFTFAIMGAWTAFEYRAAKLASTEPFLLLYLAFYLGLAGLYAFKQPLERRGLIDGTIVFGTPVAAFALQSQYVEHLAFGLSYSAAGLSALYLSLAAWLWRFRDVGMGFLSEAFLALGIAFGTLAIPFTFDARVTSAAWALEGAALVWVSVRQLRLLPRLFGLALTLLAGLVLLGDVMGSDAKLAPDGRFLGGVLISASGSFVSFYLYRHAERLRAWERWLHVPLLAWGLLWWFGAAIDELARRVPDTGNAQPSALLLLFAASFALMAEVERRLEWRALRVPPTLLLPLAALIALGMAASWDDMSLLGDWGGPAWAIALAIQYWLLHRYESAWHRVLVGAWQVATLWLIAFLLSAQVTWLVAEALDLADAWVLSAIGLTPAVIVLVLAQFGRRLAWPLRRFERALLGPGTGVISAAILIWEIFALFSSGTPRPLVYVPVLSPLDGAQVFGLAAVLRWALLARREPVSLAEHLPPALVYAVVGTSAFAWLNAAVARSVHAWTGAPYRMSALFDSVAFQSAIAILWTVTALALMAGAARMKSRATWALGAALLGLVILKLFLVDTSGTGTIARIVSFLGVGVLMLVIGYLAPLPPSRDISRRSPVHDPNPPRPPPP